MPRVRNFNELLDTGPGAFLWCDEQLEAGEVCPSVADGKCTAGQPCLYIHYPGNFFIGRSSRHIHQWDGDRDAPTLTPSLGHGKRPDGSYIWHGYLKGGILEEG